MAKEESELYDETDWSFEHSPESFFTGTELHAVEACNAVNEIWQPNDQKEDNHESLARWRWLLQILMQIK